VLILRQQSTEGKLINLIEHLEQQTITKIKFQKSQIRQTKTAVGVEALVIHDFLQAKFY
jgi:hypothetical protein